MNADARYQKLLEMARVATELSRRCEEETAAYRRSIVSEFAQPGQKSELEAIEVRTDELLASVPELEALLKSALELFEQYVEGGNANHPDRTRLTELYRELSLTQRSLSQAQRNLNFILGFLSNLPAERSNSLSQSTSQRISSTTRHFGQTVEQFLVARNRLLHTPTTR